MILEAWSKANMIPVLFCPQLFGQSQTVWKLAGIRPEPNAKPVFGAALMIIHKQQGKAFGEWTVLPPKWAGQSMQSEPNAILKKSAAVVSRDSRLTTVCQENGC